jgi:mono/diheme cytochrome c family protein
MRRSCILLLGLTAAVTLSACAKGAKSTETAQQSSTASADGSKIFLVNCVSCHQVDGKGVPGTFPPLARNAVVAGDPVKVIHIVKYGLTGPVVVAGKTFNGMMPAWSPQLSDADIAAAITYVRSSWGNHATPVTAAQVSAVSK